MDIFFDTEFTGLTDDAKLISIGLIDEQGNTFYGETINHYTIDECGKFCQEFVLPHLIRSNLKNNQYTFYQLSKYLSYWLAERSNVVLICDSKRDILQINQLFPMGLPKDVSVKKLNFFSNCLRGIINHNSRIHKNYYLTPHHALDDAIVNQMIIQKHIVK